MSSTVQRKLRADAQTIFTVAGWCVVGLVGLATIYLTLLTPTLTPGFVTAIKVVIVLTTCMVGIQSHMSALALVRAACVLGERLVPERLWFTWFRSSLAPLQWAVGGSALGSVALLAFPGTPLRWATGAALMSACAAVVFVRVLVTRGFLPRPWAWSIWAVMALFAVLVLSAEGELSALDLFGQLPVGLQLLTVAAWPAVYYTIRARWSQQLPKAQLGRVEVQLNLWRKAGSYLKRYVPLRHFGSQFPTTTSKFTTGAASINWLAFLITMVYASFFLNHWPRLVPTWDSVLGLEHITFTVLLGCNFIQLLVCKDWHWRAVLAPGGLQRGRLGTHIFLSTLQFFVLSAMAIWIAAAAISQLMGRSETLVSVGVLERFALLPLQVVFAMAIANVIRATGNPRVAFAVVLIILTLIFLAVMSMSFEGKLPLAPDWCRAGPGYVAIVLLLSAAAIWISNRMWTAQRLMIAASTWRG